MTKLQEFKDASARLTEAHRRIEVHSGLLVRGNISPTERREMAEAATELKAARLALAKAEKAYKATPKVGSP